MHAAVLDNLDLLSLVVRVFMKIDIRNTSCSKLRKVTLVVKLYVYPVYY